MAGHAACESACTARRPLEPCTRAWRCAGELDLDKVPFWQFNGKYLDLPLAEVNVKHEDVDGREFCPWQYPDIHEKL